MPNNEFMALFGSKSVITSNLSENDSVKYKLVVRGSNGDSRINEVEVTLNDADLIDRAKQRSTGFNLAVINSDTMTFVEWKSFDVYNPLLNDRQAFIDYVKSLPTNRIVAIYTYGRISSSSTLDDFITGYMGSLAWPGYKWFDRPVRTTPDSNPVCSSYSAIFNAKMRKITTENFVGNIGASLLEDSRSFCECVFDTIDDVGATGIPQRIVDDLTERTGNGSAYTVYTWPVSPKVGTDVFVGDIMRLTGDLYQDQTLTDLSGYAIVSVSALNSSGTTIAETRIDSRGAVNKFTSKEEYFTVPDNADRIVVNQYHFPSTAKSGVSKARNVILTKVSRTSKTTGTAAIGVNGIRIDVARERDSSGNDNPLTGLLKLPVANKGVSSSKDIRSGNFGELETFIDDPATYDSGTAALTYQFKSFVAQDVMLSSLNLKPGDTLTLSAEMSRDSAALSGGKYAYLVARFAQGDTYLSDDGPIGQTTIPGVFGFFKKDVIIPAGADRMRMYVVRGPNGLNNPGAVTIRNVKYRVKRGA
ncbi:large distal tail fiber subunit [Pantoea phage Phynn]|nr:large distal tail fiber subunit [Pantoea phage Phynn]